MTSCQYEPDANGCNVRLFVPEKQTADLRCTEQFGGKRGSKMSDEQDLVLMSLPLAT